MSSAEELRAEACRLRETINTINDPALKQELAARAFELAERAEAMARLPENPEIIGANIERYRKMLAAGMDDPTQKRVVEEMLCDAEQMLATARGRI
jgi:hypothetical protein